MSRAAAALAGALLLAGCPLPQPLPDYPAGSITPPRILSDPLFVGSSAVVFVPAGCTSTEPSYDLNVSVSDTNTIETIDARWFVNYDARYQQQYTPVATRAVQPSADGSTLVRVVPTYTFRPYQYRETLGSPVPVSGIPPYADAGILRTVELVVSNGFDTVEDQSTLPLPYRTAQAGFETQVHRWVFMTVTPTAAIPCP